MSKITNDGLTRSGTGCFMTVPIWQRWALMFDVKGQYYLPKVRPLMKIDHLGIWLTGVDRDWLLWLFP